MQAHLLPSSGLSYGGRASEESSALCYFFLPGSHSFSSLTCLECAISCVSDICHVTFFLLYLESGHVPQLHRLQSIGYGGQLGFLIRTGQGANAV